VVSAWRGPVIPAKPSMFPKQISGTSEKESRCEVSETTAVLFGVIAKLSNGNVHQVLLNQEQYDRVVEAIRLFCGSPLGVHASVLPLTIEKAEKAVTHE
jgi:hypothetical protein